MSNQREQGKVKIGIGFDVEQKGIKTLRKQLMDIQKISVDTYKKMSGDNLKTEQAQKELNKIKTTAKQVEKALNNAFNSRLNTVNIQQFKKQLNGLSWGKIYSDFNKLGATGNKAFNSLTNGVLSTNAELKKTDSILDKFAKTLGNSIKWTAASAAVKGVAASVQQAFGYVKSLDNSLNNIRIVTKKSSEEMAEFAVQANKAAKALGASTTDYTDAALIYAQQGLSDKQIKARTEVTLKAANVTKQSAETVSQQLTAVWNGFKINAEESQLAVDRLAAVASKSASSLKQLALGMSKVASAANSMGTSEEQLAAQISTIISVTRQAPETVGAALKTIYARISDIEAGLDEDGVTLGLYSGKMAQLGINVLDTNGKLRDQGQVIEEIGGKWQNLTREQQVSLAQTMAGQRQYSNLIALFDNFEHYNQMLKVAQNAEGELSTQQAIYMDSSAAKAKQLKAALQGFQDSLLDADSIKAGTEALTALVSVLEKFLDSIGGGIGLLGTLGGLGLTVFSNQISKGIDNAISKFDRFKNNAQQVRNVLDELVEVQESVEFQATWDKNINKDDAETLVKNLDLRRELLQKTSLMSKEQFNDYQTQLQEAKEVANKVLQTREEADEFRKKIQWTTGNAGQKIEDIKIDRESLKKYKEQVEQTQKQFEILKEAAHSFSQEENFDFEFNAIGSKKHKQIEDEISRLSGFLLEQQQRSVMVERNREKLEEEQKKNDYQGKKAILQQEIAKIKEDIASIDNIWSLQLEGNQKEFDRLQKLLQQKQKNLKSLEKQIKDFEERKKDNQDEQKDIDQTKQYVEDAEERRKQAVEAREEFKQQTKVAGILSKNYEKLEGDISAINDLLNEDKAFDNQRENLKKLSQTIEKTQEQLQQAYLNADTPEDVINSYKEKLEGFKGQLDKIVDEIVKTYIETGKTIDSQLLDKFNLDQKHRQQLQAYLDIVRKLNAENELQQRKLNLKKGSDALGGIIQGATGLIQLENAAKAFKQADLGKTLSNLMVTLPLIGNGVRKVSTAFGALTPITKACAENLGVFNKKQLESTFAFKRIKGDSEEAGLYIKAFNSYLQITPNMITGVITGIGLLVGAYSLLKGWIEAVRQTAIQNAEAIIEEENKKQEEIKTNQQLSESLKELQKKYEDGQLTRLELKNSVEEVIQQYGLQGQAVDRLRNSYLQLNGAVKGFDIQLNKELTRSLKAERDAAFDAFYNKTIGKSDWFGTHQIREVEQDKFEASAKISDFVLEELSLTKAELEELGIVVDSITQMNGNVVTTLKIAGQGNTKGAAVLEEYNKTKALQDLILEKQESGQITRPLENIISYQKILEQFKRADGTYETAKESEKYYKQQIAANAILNSGADFSNIKTYAEYLQEYQKAKDSLEQLQKTNPAEITDINEAFEAFARKNIAEIYNKYTDPYIKTFVEQIQKQGLQIDNKAKQALFNFSDNQISALSNVDMTLIHEYEDLAKVLNTIANLDFDNITAFLKAGDVEKARETAQNKFSILSSLEEQVNEGKSISASQMKNILQNLPEEEGKMVAGYFSQMANGSYQMTKNFQEFSQTLQRLSLSGLQEINTQLNKNIELAEKLKYSAFNIEDNLKYYDVENTYSNMFPGSGGLEPETPNYDIIKYQLKLLDLYKQLDPVIKTNIENWQTETKAKTLGAESAHLIADKYSQIAAKIRDLDSLDNLTKEQTELWHQMYDAMFPTDSDVDAKLLQQTTDYLQRQAKEASELGKVLADTLKEDGRAAEDVAESFIRFGAAIEKVQKNYQDWLYALSEGQGLDLVTLNQLKDAYADLMNISNNNTLSQEFLNSTANLNDMKLATEGNIEAYNRLVAAAQEDLILHIDFNEDYGNEGQSKVEYFKQELQGISDILDEIEFQNYNVGDYITTDSFFEKLNDMVNAAGLTATQVNDLLCLMGINAEVVEDTTEGEQVNQVTGFTPEFKSSTAPMRVPYAARKMSDLMGIELPTAEGEYEAQQLTYKPVKSQITAGKQNKTFAVRVTSAQKSAGGQIKHKNNVRTSSPKAPKTSSPKGSSGGKGKQPDTSKIDAIKQQKTKKDPYYEVNRKLSQTNKQLERTQKTQEKLFGKGLLNNLQKQNKLLQQQKKLLKQRQKIEQSELKTQKEHLKGLGVEFDQYGNISNYAKIITAKEAEINNLREQANQISEEYNANTDSDTKKAIKERYEEAKKQYEEQKKNLDQLIKDITEYDKLKDQIGSTGDDIAEAISKQIELKVQALDLKIQLRLDMGQAIRDWNDFYNKIVTKKKNPLTTTALQQTSNEIETNLKTLNSYAQTGQVAALENTLSIIQRAIQTIDNGGKDSIFGDNKALAIEKYNQDLEKLKDQLDNINSSEENIFNAILSQADNIKAVYDQQIEGLKTINQYYQYRLDLINLLYGDKQYSRMTQWYQKIQNNNQEQISYLRQQQQMWKQAFEDQKLRNPKNTNLIKKYADNYKAVTAQLNQIVKSSLDSLYNSYVNNVNKTFDDANKVLFNQESWDYLQKKWELIKKDSQKYLNNVNAAYAIQNVQNKYEKSIKETQSVKNQRVLRNLMAQQVKLLQNKNKLTQYDVDRAEKLLQLEQARIALEEARESKATMRLKRDSQGNYSYQYVADSSAIEDANAKYLEQQVNLHQFDRQEYLSNLQLIEQTLKEAQDSLTDLFINEKDANERQRKAALIANKTNDYLNDLIKDNQVIRNNLLNSTYNATIALNGSTDKTPEELLSEIVPESNKEIQTLISENADTAFNKWFNTVYEKLTQEVSKYEKETKDLTSSTQSFASDVYNAFSEDLNTLGQKMSNQLQSINDIKSFMKEYTESFKTHINRTQKYQDFMISQYANNLTAGKSALANEKLIEGIAGAMHYDSDSWGENAALVRLNLGTIFGYENAEQLYNLIMKRKKQGNFDKKSEYKKYSIQNIRKKYLGFDSGGYTGNWQNEEGKLALLHKKQLVLNQQDTKNILNAVNLLRNAIDLTPLLSKISNISVGSYKEIERDTIQQVVQIEASFPNATDKQEIENAFNDLVNLAAQRVMRNN